MPPFSKKERNKMTLDLIMHLVLVCFNILSIIMITCLIMDMIMLERYHRLDKKLMDLIESGEISYIQAVKKYVEINDRKQKKK